MHQTHSFAGCRGGLRLRLWDYFDCYRFSLSCLTMPETRQLAAIMFTDIVGYTALMGNDEKKAFKAHKHNRLLHIYDHWFLTQ